MMFWQVRWFGCWPGGAVQKRQGALPVMAPSLPRRGLVQCSTYVVSSVNVAMQNIHTAPFPPAVKAGFEAGQPLGTLRLRWADSRLALLAMAAPE